MTVPAGTLQTYQGVANAEDFEDVVYDISPRETPILSMAKKLKAENVTHQWTTDVLDTASATNANIQGDDAAANTAVPAVALKNYCQLMDRVAFVSDSQDATKSYGNVNKMSYQVAKRVKELKRDLEAALGQNNAGTAGAAASAALMASLESWLAYDGKQAATIRPAAGTSVGTGTSQTTPGFTTANGVPITAPTDSTVTGSVSEAILKTVIAACYSAGGEPTVFVMSPGVKQKVSGFSGLATRFREVPSMKQAQIIGGADIYVSDFMEHRLEPSRFVRNSVILGLTPEYIGVAYLQPFSQRDLAITGHAQKRLVKVEATLVVQNPWAHFKIGDINPAL